MWLLFFCTGLLVNALSMLCAACLAQVLLLLLLLVGYLHLSLTSFV
jgi:hypothetical protein